MLERGPRILPRKYVLFDVLPQPVEVTIARATLPQLHYCRGRLGYRDAALNEIGKHDERARERFTRALAAEFGQRFERDAGLQCRDCGGPLGFVERRTERDADV